jgi:hypothetical protein
MGPTTSWRTMGLPRAALFPDLAGCQSSLQANLAGGYLGDPATAHDNADLHVAIWKISGH